MVKLWRALSIKWKKSRFFNLKTGLDTALDQLDTRLSGKLNYVLVQSAFFGPGTICADLVRFGSKGRSD
jgi:hypothetical protein